MAQIDLLGSRVNTNLIPRKSGVGSTLEDLFTEEFLAEVRGANPHDLPPLHVPFEEYGDYFTLWSQSKDLERTFAGGVILPMGRPGDSIYRITIEHGYIDVLGSCKRKKSEQRVRFYYRPPGPRGKPIKKYRRYSDKDLPLDSTTMRVKQESSHSISKVEMDFILWIGKVKDQEYTPQGAKRIGLVRALKEYQEGIRIWEPTISEKEIGHSANYIASAKEHFGNKTLERITRRLVKDYLAHLVRDKHCAYATANRYINRLSRFFSWAIDKEYVSVNPCVQVRFSAKYLNRRTQVLSAKEIAEIFAAADEDTRIFLLLITAVGLRLAAAMTLRFDQFDHGRQVLFLTVDQSKNKRENEVMLSPKVLSVIAKWQEKHPGWSFLFGPSRPTINVRAKFSGLRDKLPWMKERGISAHTFRHTFATTMKASGAPTETIQKFMTHKDPRSTEIYLHTEFHQDDKRFIDSVAAKLIPSFITDQDEEPCK